MKSQDLIEDSKKIPEGRKINRDFHFLWPFFSKTSGKYSSGFKIWPLYGYTKKIDNQTLLPIKESKFYLWQIYQ